MDRNRFDDCVIMPYVQMIQRHNRLREAASQRVHSSGSLIIHCVSPSQLIIARMRIVMGLESMMHDALMGDSALLPRAPFIFMDQGLHTARHKRTSPC